jgi:hypothetical protein
VFFGISGGSNEAEVSFTQLSGAFFLQTKQLSEILYEPYRDWLRLNFFKCQYKTWH